MKYLLFGTGDYYERYQKWFADKEVLALLDNSRQKQHQLLDGLEILPPEEGVKLPYDAIIILSFYYEQMKRQLLALKVREDQIYHFYTLRRLFSATGRQTWGRPLQYGPGAREVLEEKENGRQKFLLLSPELTLGGPSIALFHAAVLLKKHGYEVVYASMLDGVLREKLIRYHIPVLIDENLQLATMDETEWVHTFSLIICNTLNFHVFLSERSSTIPVIWWLHDASFFYDGVDRSVIGKINPAYLTAVSVGPVPEAAVKEFLPELDCGELLYGVADVLTEKAVYGRQVHGDTDVFLAGSGCKEPWRKAAARQETKILRFVTVGFLEDIKGQDILVEAVKSLPADSRRACAFVIVGHCGTLFGESVQRESAGLDEVVFTGSVSRENIHALLAASDVLICPSRQDSMPTVAAEAMMHAVPCIMSDAAGTAAYLSDGRDGFVFPSGDAQALAEKILWCLGHKAELEGIGQRARRLYERYFSMPAFERRLLEIVHGILP